MAGGFRFTNLPPNAALLEPGPGIDPAQPDRSIEAIVAHAQQSGVAVVYYDLSDVAIIDGAYLDYLNHLARACRAVDAHLVCIHIRPEAAHGLARLLITRERAFETAQEVQGSATPQA